MEFRSSCCGLTLAFASGKCNGNAAKVLFVRDLVARRFSSMRTAELFSRRLPECEEDSFVGQKFPFMESNADLVPARQQKSAAGLAAEAVSHEAVGLGQG